MDKPTKNYRIAQLENVKHEYREFKTKIKLIKPCGETNWLDIENAEFDAISKILKGESVVYISDDAKKVQTPESKGWKNFPQGLVDCQ